jgi:SAM-dependent methyltransferase
LNVRRTIRRTPKIIRNALRDLRYGSLLGGTITTRHAHLGAFDIANTDYDDLARLFAEIEVRREDVIVDVGCGKGRVINWLLSRYPQNTIYGIELDPEVCARTARRLRRHARVKIVCGDATQVLPEEGTLFYLFNPFGEEVLRRFVDTALGTNATARRFVYYNCKFVQVFLDDPRFEVRTIDLTGSHRSAIVHVRAS